MARTGPALKQVSLDDKYALDTARAYMTGIEALVRLPMLQHQRDLSRGLNTAAFISGYRGSPLGAVDQQLWQARKYLEENQIQFQKHGIKVHISISLSSLCMYCI